MSSQLHLVQFEIAPRPVLISIGQVDAHRFPRAAGCRIKAAGIGKQVEEALAVAAIAYLGAGDAMIEEEPAIQISIEVDDE